MSRFRYFGTAAHGGLRLLLRGAGAVVAAVAALLVGVAVWLAQGPVSVGFLTPYLQDALRDTGYEVDIADTVLHWRGFDDGLDVRLTDARVRGRGADAAQVMLPALHLRLSGRALLRGELRPAAVEVDGARLRLVREADGRVELGLSGAGGAGEGISDSGFGEWLRSFAEQGDSAMAELKRIVLRGADLAIEDRALGRTFRAPRTDFAVWRDSGLIGATLTGAIEFGAKPVNLALDARWRGGAAPVEAGLRFDGLDPATLAGLDPSLQPLAALRMPLSGRLQGSFSRDGPTGPVAFSLAGTDGVLDLPERFPKPVGVRKVELQGDLTARFQAGMPQLERLRLEQLELQTAGPRIAGQAAATWASGGPGIQAQVGITGLALKDLALYWPIGMASNARDWVTQNIQDGVVPEAKLSANIAPGALASPPREALLFQFSFEGVTADYLKRMPKITQGKGQARIDPREFQLDLVSGRAGKLALSEGRLVIDGLHVKDQNADIQLAVTGTVPAGLELLDSPPLGLATRFGFAPANAGGNAAARLRFGFPVEHSLTMEQVRFNVAANITDLALKGLFDQYEMARGTVAITCNPKGLAAEGQGVLVGIPLNFKWREEFGVPGAPSRYEASAVLDEAARARLGLGADAYLAGPVPVTVNAAVRRGGAVEAKVEAILDRATLKLDELEWRKPIGVAGRASTTVRAPGGGAPVKLDELALDAGDLSVRGRIELDKDTLRLAELTRVKYAEADIALRIERDARGNSNVTLNGARVDLRRFNPPPTAKPPPPNPRPIPGPVDMSKPRVAVKIGRLDRVLLSDKMSFASVVGEMEVYGGRLGSLRARGTLEDGPPLGVEIAPAGRRRTLQVTTEDAARLARALDLLDGAEGGKLALRGELRDDEPGGPLVGRVLVDEFRLRRAPILARILSLGSLTGISDLLTGSGIAFARLEIPFTQLDDVISIADARAVGPALGLSAEGTLDRAKDRLDLRGTVVPAYTINSVLGNIPLLGTLLVGRKGEGVFAITFRVTGSADDPSVSVNPLTALAPGFLRTIIGVLERGIEESLPGKPAPSDSPGSERR